ncbi:ABC transporter ATP-binding protein [Pseudomonadota bacterium]
MSDKTATLKAQNLSKVYHTGEVDVCALAGVDLSLYQGELVVLLGASGSGKSTLLNILGGLDRPTTGSVHFEGRDLTQLSDAELTLYRRDHVGFVFQFYNLVASLTARENVELVTEIAKNPMTASEALNMVGLGERMDHFPAELSGGEQQRVAIARAIAKRPGILMCDEPTGALDSKTGILVLDAVAAINRDLGATTAVITHNAVIADMADRVLIIGDGEIQEVRKNATKKSPGELSW